MDVTTINTLNTGNLCGNEEYIDDSLNVTDDLYSLPFPDNVLSPSIQTAEPSRILPLVISSSAPCVNSLVKSVFLHSSYPFIEPNLSGGVSTTHSIYGQRFGITSQDTNGDFYGRPVSDCELLLFYSTPRDIIPPCGNSSQLDINLDALLRRCLLFCMVDLISSSTSQLDRIYDTLLVDDDDASNVAICYHVKPSPKSDLD